MKKANNSKRKINFLNKKWIIPMIIIIVSIIILAVSVLLIYNSKKSVTISLDAPPSSTYIWTYEGTSDGQNEIVIVEQSTKNKLVNIFKPMDGAFRIDIYKLKGIFPGTTTLTFKCIKIVDESTFEATYTNKYTVVVDENLNIKIKNIEKNNTPEIVENPNKSKDLNVENTENITENLIETETETKDTNNTTSPRN